MEPKTVRRDDGMLPARHLESLGGHPAPLNALVAGTTVLTLDGALPVEVLSPGDRVITRDCGAVAVTALQRFTRTVPLVAIRAGCMGNSRPEGDLLLPERQEILLRGWRASALFGARRALVPLSRIIDGHFVSRVGPRLVPLVALCFEAPHILYADGLELASATPREAGRR
ncbi:Hint domain-containing protein [Salipiger sp. H15]|uniref:Hint domain-containing protein n=1 Tax=Alloyangia sp. H15 TaxID=3029062 RepID=A0AAU8ADW1_9RHOB